LRGLSSVLNIDFEQRSCRCDEAQNYTMAKIRKRVLVLSEGVMVRICRLLEAAAIQAIETKHEHINLQTLTDDLTTETLVSISDRRSRRTAN